MNAFGLVLLDDIEHGECSQRVDDHGGAVFVPYAVDERDAAGGLRDGVLAPRAGSAGSGNESDPLAKIAIGQRTAAGGDHFTDAFEPGRIALDTRLAVQALNEHLVGRVDRRQRHLDADLSFAGLGHRQVTQLNERFHRGQRCVIGTFRGVAVALEDECLHRVGHCWCSSCVCEESSLSSGPVASLPSAPKRPNQRRPTKN